MATTFIYALCEPGTRTVRYIGKTGGLKKRLREHLKKSITMSTYLGHWLSSLQESPNLVVLREVIGSGFEEEKKYICLARRMGMRLVNSTDGGEGVTMTPEIRAKIGAKNRGRQREPMPEHTREALLEANTGRQMTEKNKRALKEVNYGHPRSLETRAKLRIAGRAGKGRKRSEETKARMSAAQFLRFQKERELKGVK